MTQTPSALDTQIGGSHYKNMAIQPMEFSMANKLDACQHTIIKYVARFRDKGGITDLEKAKHVIDMLIEFESQDEPKAAGPDLDAVLEPALTGLETFLAATIARAEADAVRAGMQADNDDCNDPTCVQHNPELAKAVEVLRRAGVLRGAGVLREV